MSGGAGVLPPRARRWLEAWHGGDPAVVAALYATDGTHESAKVAVSMPELGRMMLRGRVEIEEYARRAFARVGRLRFEVTHVVEDSRGCAVEYVRTTAVDPAPTRVLEMMEWDGGRMTACRVYHF